MASTSGAADSSPTGNTSTIGSNKHETVITIASSHMAQRGERFDDKKPIGGDGGGAAGSAGSTGSGAAGSDADLDDDDDRKPPAPRSAARGSPLAAVLYIVTAVALVRKTRKFQKPFSFPFALVFFCFSFFFHFFFFFLSGAFQQKRVEWSIFAQCSCSYAIDSTTRQYVSTVTFRAVF
jgi:hypothetical protein